MKRDVASAKNARNKADKRAKTAEDALAEAESKNQKQKTKLSKATMDKKAQEIAERWAFKYDAELLGSASSVSSAAMISWVILTKPHRLTSCFWHKRHTNRSHTCHGPDRTQIVMHAFVNNTFTVTDA